MKNFFDYQSEKQKEEYEMLLKSLGSLSNLFSDSKKPFIYYRTHENAFCRSFKARNHARSDISFDATKGKYGIGLKTFVISSNRKREKIAEFNRNRKDFSQYENDPQDFCEYISILRNERLQLARNICGTEQMVYHCLLRDDGKMYLHEESMEFIDIDNIEVLVFRKGISVSFTDNKSEYSFNFSKSTLFKVFQLEKKHEISVAMLSDPFDAILQLAQSQQGGENTESIILPLYSHRNHDVPKRSQLNQWNASGRERDEREVYIPIPSWIHKRFKDFFPPQDETFNLILPNQNTLTAKVCQQGGKALMSNPNKDLGEWLLGTVLGLPKGKLLKYSDLERLGVDSVEITRYPDKSYSIDFKALSTYEHFFDENR